MLLKTVKLTQIKDCYTNNPDILRPLIALLHQLSFLPEMIAVTKAEEYSDVYQVFEPLPDYAYLIQAAKMAFSHPVDQAEIEVPIIVIDDEPITIQQTFKESQRVRIVLSQGDKAIALFAQGVKKVMADNAKLEQFADLVNSAEIEPY